MDYFPPAVVTGGVRCCISFTGLMYVLNLKDVLRNFLQGQAVNFVVFIFLFSSAEFSTNLRSVGFFSPYRVFSLPHPESLYLSRS